MMDDRLTEIDRLRLHIRNDLSAPCLDSLLDEVEALEAALERVTLNRDGLTADNDELTAALAEKEAEVARLRDGRDFLAQKSVDMAEQLDRLQTALRSIAANTCCDRCQEAALVARAALNEKTPAD